MVLRGKKISLYLLINAVYRTSIECIYVDLIILICALKDQITFLHVPNTVSGRVLYCNSTILRHNFRLGYNT